MLDKKKIVACIIDQLEKDLMMTKAAAIATYEAATHEESKPENEYDTRGLEASYLAGAQAKRAAEIDETLAIFRTTLFRDFSKQDVIESTALVEVQGEGNKKSLLLVMPMGGGSRLDFEGGSVQVITPHSVLGEALLGLRVGDTAEVEIGSRLIEYQILSLQ